jgi:ketosteroid isomerase-like protein
MMKRFLFLVCMVVSLPAAAGKLDEAHAKAHVEAVAAGDLEAVMRDYPKGAFMEWVGGPLDGQYRGTEAIRAVWKKFFAANEGKPRPARFGELESYSSAKGASIEITAEYGGKTPLKVWHVLVYRDGALVAEIWQIESGESK